ncbi:hypothetical protein TSUD_408540 [Trifolium subterraneum]|uniref:Glycoside hydrolase family 38 N-terminal domain-containing protein n=1 Tax=Trifolium subterraneum TaxID=3900 RepID=A0A2Z6P0X8_TRISU|nr:hypothetical protein TSUD_408540 [Trifolium subterraneum]
MHDEATSHYTGLFDHTTLGHQFIKDEFGKIPIDWQIDPFGHSIVHAYLLGAEDPKEAKTPLIEVQGPNSMSVINISRSKIPSMSVWGSPYLGRFPSKHNNILNSQLQCTYDISRFRVRFDDPMVENKELRVEKLKMELEENDANGKFDDHVG